VKSETGGNWVSVVMAVHLVLEIHRRILVSISILLTCVGAWEGMGLYVPPCSICAFDCPEPGEAFEV